jgi:hypothetical protein
MAYVYKHIRKDTNEVFYIGIGKTKRRPTDKNNRNDRWTKLVNKVGFYAEIIEDGLTWQQACELEIKLIKQYGRRDLNEGSLVNMTDGGDGFVGTHSEETKAKLKQRYVSPELRKKLSELKKGKSTGRFGSLNPQYGIPMTDEQKQKISASKKGKPLSENHKRALSESQKKRFGKLE